MHSENQLYLDSVPEGSKGDCGVLRSSWLAVAEGSAVCELCEDAVQDLDGSAASVADALHGVPVQPILSLHKKRYCCATFCNDFLTIPGTVCKVTYFQSFLDLARKLSIYFSETYTMLEIYLRVRNNIEQFFGRFVEIPLSASLQLSKHTAVHGQ